VTTTKHSSVAEATTARMLWLDLTRKCQLECSHCYNRSGPKSDHGTMSREDWFTVVDQAAANGTELVQLIGGEPTLHPDALDIAHRVLTAGMRVEVYSNLIHVSDSWWELFQRPGALVATSYYSADPDQHNARTGRAASHRHTRRNIARAVELGVSLRAGIVTVEGRGVEETRRELEALGVTRIGVDRVRPFGRGADGRAPDTAGLCGACGDERAAISPDGQVSPCVFSTWMSVGAVQRSPLADILSGPAMAQARDEIMAGKDSDDPPIFIPCGPDKDICKPGGPPSECDPRH
jgi:MoaA/NifB/PqqE/SkfB family radical SAM enzyme